MTETTYTWKETPEGTLQLKNGTEHRAPLVMTLYHALRCLIAQKPIVFLDLVTFCRSEACWMFGKSGEQLHELGLAEKHGARFKAHSVVCDVVLSAVEGEGSDLTLRNPIEKDSES